MLCANCYDLWLQSRPIGAGACCQSCGDRRRAHLRYFELPRGFAVLCHNCTAQAQVLPRLPRSVEGLMERLERERRRGERRSPGGAATPGAPERRRLRERRVGARDLFDATEFAVEVQDEPLADSALTRIHRLA